MTLLGRGVYSEVYLDTCAVKKYLNPGSDDDNDIAYDAIREASIMRHLNECEVSCVPHIHNVSSKQGRIFVTTKTTMENIPGKPLFVLLESLNTCEDRCALVEKHFDDILKAIEEIHQTGVVHNDLTPRNIMITPDNTVAIIDFGLSSFSDCFEQNLASHTTPEWLAAKIQTIESDYWTLAISIIRMCLDVVPDDTELPPLSFSKKTTIKEFLDDSNSNVVIHQMITSTLAEKLRPLLKFRKSERKTTKVIPYKLTTEWIPLDSSHSEYYRSAVKFITVLFKVHVYKLHRAKIGVVLDIFRRVFPVLQCKYSASRLICNIGSIISENYEIPRTHSVKVEILEIIQWKVYTRSNVQLSGNSPHSLLELCNKLEQDEHPELLFSMSDTQIKEYFDGSL